MSLKNRAEAEVVAGDYRPAPVQALWVVAIAASAGGLAALTHVLSGLPSFFPAPVLVVQHLDPHHRSWMAEILDRRVGLRVVQACGGERIAAGTIYLAPPNHHLLVDALGTLALSDADRVRFSRPSADLLFASLAESFGPRAVAVVLSGSGRDGADGVRAVKERGGTVLVQDDAAEFRGMPEAAVRTGAADRVLPLAEIAGALVELVGGAGAEGER